MNVKTLISTTAMAAALCSYGAIAASEIEPNDSFSDRNILQPGDSTFLANLFAGTCENGDCFGDYGDYGDYGDFNTTASEIEADGNSPMGGDVDFFSFTGLAAGSAFQLNFTGPNFREPGFGLGELISAESSDFISPIIGLFDNAGTLTSASANRNMVFGAVGSSGALNIGLTGFGDVDFIGSHTDSGDYQVELLLNDEFVVLPDDSSDGVFSFTNVFVEDGDIIFIDPIVAIGYDYTSSALDFSTVTLPALPMDTMFDISYVDGNGMSVLVQDVLANTEFSFGGAGVRAFTVTGIDGTEMLDPNDPFAFTTGLTFFGNGSTDLQQTAITAEVPLPPALALMGLGTLLLRRRKSKTAL